MEEQGIWAGGAVKQTAMFPFYACCYKQYFGRRVDCLRHIVYTTLLRSDGKVPNSGFLAKDMVYGWRVECDFGG